MVGRSWLLLPLIAALTGCSGTPFGEALSGSFSTPLPAPATPVPSSAPSPTPVATEPPGRQPASPRPSPAGTAPAPKAPAPQAPAPQAQAPTAPAPAPRPGPTAPPSGAAPYRVTLRLPQADPAAPAEALTRALRAAGVSFTVERIETVGGAPAPAAAAP
ncbi:MAG: hypothetical protein VKM01_01435 [Cyanobacteriota bacterium]|nr:hypothetical protein [Cyanobacteriota bacterium]